MPILFSDSSSLTTAPAGGGEWTKESTTTLSSSATIQEFTLDFSTYKQWKFVGENINFDQSNSGYSNAFCLKGKTAHSSGSSQWLLGATSGYAWYDKWAYTCRKWGNQNSSNGATHYYSNVYRNESDSDNGAPLGQTGDCINFELTTNNWSLTDGTAAACPKWWGWWSSDASPNDDGQYPKHAFNHFSGALTHWQSHQMDYAQDACRFDFARGDTGKTITGKIHLYRRT
jgi:hypothetical protein